MKLILLYWIAFGSGISMSLPTLVRPTGLLYLSSQLASHDAFFAIGLLTWYAEKRVTREATIVFERETDKVYMPVDDDTPHVALDFYDQYFYLHHPRNGGRNSARCALPLSAEGKTGGRA